MSETIPLFTLLLLGFISTTPWRWLGVYFTNNLDETHEAIIWARAVSNALIAALVMRLIFLPPEDLGSEPLWLRLIALAIASLIYLLAGRHMLPAIAGAFVAFLIISHSL